MASGTGPMLGRDADLDLLRSGVGLDSGAGGLVVLSGDAGIGKSRLVGALTSDAADRGRLTATGHCVGVAGSDLAHLPFIELRANESACTATQPTHRTKRSGIRPTIDADERAFSSPARTQP